MSGSKQASSLKKEEDLINAYEAEEERIINTLSRKLEQLQQEKVALENTLEAESESHVNRLNRELSALRLAQQQQQATNSVSGSPDTRTGVLDLHHVSDPTAPSSEVLLEAMRRENEQLRNRLVDTERDYIRIARLNEIYREELLEHRRRLGLSVDNLVGLSSAEPFSHSIYRRRTSIRSAMPIPNSSATRRDTCNGRTTLSLHSPSSTESPSCSSPYTHPASYVSNSTEVTTPQSNTSLNELPMRIPHGLTYPSVPPPSVSSSYGSPQLYREGLAERGTLIPRSRAGSQGKMIETAPSPENAKD